MVETNFWKRYIDPSSAVLSINTNMMDSCNERQAPGDFIVCHVGVFRLSRFFFVLKTQALFAWIATFWHAAFSETTDGIQFHWKIATLVKVSIVMQMSSDVRQIPDLVIQVQVAVVDSFHAHRLVFCKN